MQDDDETIVEKLQKCYLAAYQELQFSKANKTNAEIADIERRCLFTKYTICKYSINEDVAGTILQNELDNYTRVVDNQNGLNNYWQQINSLNILTNNNPLQWKPCLSDPNLALQFLEKLPCTTENTSTCKNKNYDDKDVERVMKLWKNGGSSPRARKRSKLETNIIAINNVDNQNKEKFFDRSNRNVEIKKNNEKLSSFENQFSYCEKNHENSEKKIRNKTSFPIKNEILQIDKTDEKSQEKNVSEFKTAKVVLKNQQVKNNKNSVSNIRQASVKKSLGGKFINSPYINPLKDEQPKQEESCEPVDERFKNIEPKMIELIKNEIMDSGNPVSWDDIAGLDHAKRIIKEIVVFPMLRPDIFTGLRRPPKGILLFGPPGTGKTLIGKCIASQSKSTFFSISASSLTSKWIGEGEKMVRALFAVARVEQPSVVFIDEIDSLLCQRSETEHESSRRMKTEFLVQLDGAATGDEDRILVIGATNRPYELDEAARRRLVKRLYIPLPELEARAQIVRNLLKSECHSLTSDDIYKIAKLAEGYSGADMTNLCKEASMGPIRSIPFEELEDIRTEHVRKMTFLDFQEALNAIRPSVSQKDLSVYIDWDLTYGTASVHTGL